MAMMIPVFTNDQINQIATIAIESDIAQYDWEDRGQAPQGYIEGMALTWAQCYVKFKKGDPAMVLCAQANTGHSDTDVLSWYRGIFDKLNMSNQVAGANTLRHLFTLLLGLGMRESSGEHCCGKDASASNTGSTTCEAGFAQTSWNISSSSSEIPPLLDVWSPGDQPQCYLPIWEKEVSCPSSDWKCYGSGDGYKYQEMSKKCPPFHAEVTLVGLRELRAHWGPINNYAAEVMPAADQMFKAIQDYVDTWDQPVPPIPVPEVAQVKIETSGPVQVYVNGKLVTTDAVG